MMMYDVLVLPSAEADLDDIATYTKQRWGREQARAYLTSLRLEIEALAHFPRMHAIYRGRHGEFHKAPSGEHLIFYRLIDATVKVVRILHNRMDIDEALD